MARRTKRRISPFYNRITLVALVLVAGFLGIAVFELSSKEREAAGKRAEAERELQDIKVRQETLETDLALLRTPRGQEALVRDSFDVAKEGEEVFVVLDALPATTTDTKQNKGLLGWFLGLFE